MDRSGIDELSERLAGQVIVVEPGPDKSDLEKIALGHGATVEQNAVKGRTTKYITVRICYDCTLRDRVFQAARANTGTNTGDFFISDGRKTAIAGSDKV